MYIDDLLKFTLYWAVLLICLQFDNATAFHIHPVNLVNSQQKIPYKRCELIMRERKCDLSGTRKNSKAMSVSKSNVHTHRTQNVNLQTCRFWWAEGNKFVRLRISTRTLKTIKKNGLHRTAKKFGVNLNNFSLSSGTAPSTIPKMETNQEHDGEPSEHFENSIDHATSSVDSLNQPILSPTFLR